MKQFRSCACLGLLFLLAYKAFEHAAPLLPDSEQGRQFYFVAAATVEWMLYRLVPLFCAGKLCRDVEALCIASIVAHAFGYALYMAWTPPYFHNGIIQGINYVLAIRLIFTGGSDVYNNSGLRDLVRSIAAGRMGNQTREAQQ